MVYKNDILLIWYQALSFSLVPGYFGCFLFLLGSLYDTQPKKSFESKMMSKAFIECHEKKSRFRA